MDENTNITVLNEVSKASKMGMESISYLSEKLDEQNMKQELSSQYSTYGNIAEKVNELYQKYGKIPDDSPIKDKMMSWMGIQMNTINNTSNSHIAEILIQGNTMGIIKTQKLINSNPQVEENVKTLLNDFITTSHNNIERMKEFL